MNERLSRWARGTALIVAAAALTLVATFRTELFLSEFDTTELRGEAEADAWLDALARVHGSPRTWFEGSEVALRVRGRVPFAPARFAFGVGEGPVDLELRFVPAEHGRYWYALRQGQRHETGRVDTRHDRDGLGLLLDSIRHLFELPLSAVNAPIRRGMPTVGTSTRSFFTWGTSPAATLAHDQVILWSEGGRLVRMDTTGRDIAPFIVARVMFDGSVALGEFTLPRRATIHDDDRGGAIVHEWELLSARRSSDALTRADVTP